MSVPEAKLETKLTPECNGSALSWKVSGRVIELALHRLPCNELGSSSLEELEKFATALQLLQADAHALIIYSELKAGFCAGADLRELYQRSHSMEKAEAAKGIRDFLERIHRVLNLIDAAPLTTIAAVHGVTFGGGFELVLACDLAIASEEAVFSLPELNHGVMPNSALSLLRPIVGERVAFEMILSGRQVSAYEARERGIVNAVVPRRHALSAAIDRAREIVTRYPPGALRETKRSYRGHAPIDWTLIRQSLLGLPRKEWEEGLGAFLERRKPDYETFWRDHERR